MEKTLLILPLFLLLTSSYSCSNNVNGRMARTGPQTRSINPDEGLIPVTNITPDTPLDQKESICKKYVGLLKATCMFEINDIKRIINYYPADINKQNELGHTPLMWAAANGQIAVMKLFMGQNPSGINLNLQDKVDRTALMYAVSVPNNEEICEMLLNYNKGDLQNSVNIKLSDKWKDNALRLAYKSKSLVNVKALLDRGADPNDKFLLVNAAKSNNTDFIKLFLDHRVLPNEVDSNGTSALGEAARAGYRAPIQMIIESTSNYADDSPFKAKIDVIDQKMGSSPLILAVKSDNYGDHYDIVAYLLEHGADVNLREKSGDKLNALQYAKKLPKASDSSRDIIKLLEQHGARLPDSRISDNNVADSVDPADSVNLVGTVDMIDPVYMEDTVGQQI